ncbi:MAG: class I SAM-dependent methyltransferase [Gammaproteobacteria bacterium]
MSQSDAERWNSRYADGAYESRVHASQIVERWADCSPRGRALDVACGRGRNAVYLASKGFEVDAVDVSSVALEHAARVARANSTSGSTGSKPISMTIVSTTGLTN